MKYPTAESYGWQTRTSALALASLALAGCGSNSETPNQTPAAPRQSAETVPPIGPSESNSCTTIEVPIFPGSRLNQENADSVQKQLDALRIAKTPGAEVGVRTLFNANVIVANALADNEYAEALSTAAQQPPNAIPTVEALLASSVAANQQQCLTREQLAQVDYLSRTLIDGLGPQLGRQLSSAGQVGYDSLRDTYEDFREKYQEELTSR